MVRRPVGALVATTLMAALMAVSAAVAAPGAQAVTPLPPSSTTSSETTIGYSPARQNWDLGEPALTTVGLTQKASDGSSAFGTRWDQTIPGTTTATPNQVYAQPLVADGRVIVATDDDEIAAYDPTDGALEWKRNIGPAWTSPSGCGDLTPHIGITATPVYNPVNRTVYLIAKSATGSGAPTMTIHGIDVATGLERPGWPLTIAGSPTNGGPAFNAATSASRAGLLLGPDGDLYFGLASHCDIGPFVGYVGHVLVSDKPSLKLWATVSDNSNGQAGIWQAGGGLMSDGSDAYGDPRLFVATGNGIESDPNAGPGSAGSPQLSESVVRLAVDHSTGTLSVADFFSPSNGAQLDLDDVDLGSGGPVALSTGWGSADHPDLLVIAGKDGVVRLLDRNDLGGKDQGPNGTDAVVSSTPGSGVWGHAAVYDAGQGRHFVYLTPAGQPMAAYRVTPDAAGTPTLTQVASSADETGANPVAFPFGSGSPVVTSDPADPSTALVWVIDNAQDGGTLDAYPAIPPTSGPWERVRSYPLGHLATKFSQPATANGRLFVGTRDGHVLAFGASAAAPVIGTGTDFGSTAVGTPVTKTVTVTTSGGTAVQAVSASGPFTVGNRTTSGTTTSVPVTFAPTAAGAATGALTVTTSDGSSTALGLRGTGTANGFVATPNPIDLGTVSVGESTTRGELITNTGASPATITSAALSGSSAFSIASALPHNTGVASGAGVAITIRFTPTGAVSSSATLTLTTSTGTVALPVTGTGRTGHPVLALSAPAIDFGQVQPGVAVYGSFHVQNPGDAPFVITKAGQPGPPFVATIPVQEGSTVEPTSNGYGGIYSQIMVQPLNAMPHTDQYFINAETPDQQSVEGAPQTLAVSVNTAPWSGTVPGPTGCIAVSGAPQAGATLISRSCSSTPATLTRTSDGRLHYGAADGSLCLGTAGAGKASGTRVRLGACSTATAGQVWRIPGNGTLTDANSGLCLHVHAAGQPLDLARCTSTPVEQWDVTSLLPTRGLLSSGLGTTGQYCLGDRGNSPAAGSAIELARCTLGPTQPGQIITAVASTLRTEGGCLTVRVPKNSSGVLLGQCTGATAQWWTTDPTTHRLYNPGSKLCLYAPSTTDGTLPHMAACDSSPNERWTLPTS